MKETQWMDIRSDRQKELSYVELREKGFDGGYSMVKAYVSSRKMDLKEKATVGFETMPGKQGQMVRGFFEDHLVYEDGNKKNQTGTKPEPNEVVPVWRGGATQRCGPYPKGCGE